MSSVRKSISKIKRKIAGIDEWLESALILPKGQISVGEAIFLGKLIREADSVRPIIEIGTLFGWSTRTIVLFKPPQQPLITVDAFCWNPLGLSAEKHYAITSGVLKESVDKFGVSIVRSEKRKFYDSYDGPPPSLVFLDADHGYEQTAEDIKWARSVHAGVICLHDYSEEFPGVMRAAKEAGGVLHVVESLAVLNND